MASTKNTHKHIPPLLIVMAGAITIGISLYEYHQISEEPENRGIIANLDIIPYIHPAYILIYGSILLMFGIMMLAREELNHLRNL